MNKHHKSARYLTTGFSVLAILTMAIPASAQQCQPMLENKRFTLIVPYNPGGGYDGYARVFASQFEASTDTVMRVRNMPGAGTMIGINAVIEAGPSDLVLGLFTPNVLLNDLILGRDSPEMSSLVFLGSLHTDTTIWATRKDNPVVFESPEPRLFALANNTDFIRVLLPGYALGWNISLIRGYNGSTEGMFALLRGDVDFFFSGSISLTNQIRSIDGLNAFVSLTEGPNPLFPEIDYLAGAGGVVEQLISEMDVEQQRERREIARLSVELSKTHRAIAISSTRDPELVDCLLTAVEATAFSEELRATAAVQNLVIEPKNGAVFQEEMDRTKALIERNWELLQDLVARPR